MSGIDNNFINKFQDFTRDTSASGKKLSPEEIQQLETMVASGHIDHAAAEKLKAMIIKGGISPEEKQLLLAIGHSIKDSTKLKEIKSALDSDPVNGQISNLIGDGFKTRKEEIEREKINHSIETNVRGALEFTILPALSEAASFLLNMDLRINSIAQEAQQETQDLVSKLAPVFNNSVEDNDCIRDSLTSIAANNPGMMTINKNIPPRAVSQDYLNKVTGKKWDGLMVQEANKEGNLHKALAGQEGKALVVVGAHTFVFKGFDKEGNLKVTDPSDQNVMRTVQKNNPASSVYVMGAGDGSDSQGINKGTDVKYIKSIVKPYQAIEPNMNSADKDNAESLNIRKLFSLMASPNEKDSFDKIKGFLAGNNVTGLKNFLESKGIKLDFDELKNMVIRMNQPITVNGNQTNMISQLEKLRNSGTDSDKARYQFGIQYSDVNLKDFFTRTDANAMNKVFEDMIAGRDGC